MYRHREIFNAFAKRELREYLKENDRKIRSQIEKEPENYILNVNETEYVNYLASKFIIDKPDIDFESVFVSSYEKQIPAEQFPFGFNVRSSRSYPKQVVEEVTPNHSNYLV